MSYHCPENLYMITIAVQVAPGYTAANLILVINPVSLSFSFTFLCIAAAGQWSIKMLTPRVRDTPLSAASQHARTSQFLLLGPLSPSLSLLQCLFRLLLAGCEALSRLKIRSIGSKHRGNVRTSKFWRKSMEKKRNFFRKFTKGI